MNITFGLLEPLPVELRKKHRNKRERHSIQVERALVDWDAWLIELGRLEAFNDKRRGLQRRGSDMLGLIRAVVILIAIVFICTLVLIGLVKVRPWMMCEDPKVQTGKLNNGAPNY